MTMPRTRSRYEVAALEARLRDEMDEDEIGRGLSTRGATKMGLVGTGVAARDATEATLARMSRGVKGRGRKMRSGSEGKRPKTTGDGVWAGDEVQVAMMDEG